MSSHHRDSPPEKEMVPEQWLILVTCRDEKQQVALLERWRAEGVECKALLTGGRVVLSTRVILIPSAPSRAAYSAVLLGVLKSKAHRALEGRRSTHGEAKAP